MNSKVKVKLLNYVKRLKRVKDTGVQRVTSSCSNTSPNVCLVKEPKEWTDASDVLRRETSIKCPLCNSKNGMLIIPWNYWHSTEITCLKCGLHVSDWSANDDRVKAVRQMWKQINDLSIRQIVPFGRSWFKGE